MKLGAIFAVVLGAPAVIAIARSITHWLQRRNGTRIVIRGRSDGIQLDVKNIDSESVVRILGVLGENEEQARRRPEKERQAAETQRGAEEERQAAEAQRRAEEERQAAEAQRRAEEERRAAEAQRGAEEQRRAVPAVGGGTDNIAFLLGNQAGTAPNANAVESDEISRERDSDHLQTRLIDANLLTERFAPGEMAMLTIVVRLPSNPPRGKWQSTVALDSERGPVQVLLETMGFTCLSEPSPPFEVPEDRDSAPVAFELRIEEASTRWLHIVLTQAGRPVGELTINDFAAMGHGPVQHAASSPFRSIAEADLTLLVRAGDGRIEVCSPRDRASLDHVTMAGFKYPELPFRNLLADRLRALYDPSSDPEATARELQLVGVELAACLPVDLTKLLRRLDIRSVMLRHEDDFDFPLELVYLDDAVDPFFVGDRIAVCRWYLGVTNPPDITTKRIRRVAFLKGNAEAFRADEALLYRLYPGRTVTFSRRSDIVEKLFKSSDFDLIHFTGHCRQREQTSGGLELADGTFLR